MGGLPDNRKPLPDGRLVRYGHDIRRNPLSDGNSHSARAEKAAETFHRQFGKAELVTLGTSGVAAARRGLATARSLARFACA